MFRYFNVRFYCTLRLHRLPDFWLLKFFIFHSCETYMTLTDSLFLLFSSLLLLLLSSCRGKISFENLLIIMFSKTAIMEALYFSVVRFADRLQLHLLSLPVGSAYAASTTRYTISWKYFLPAIQKVFLFVDLDTNVVRPFHRQQYLMVYIYAGSVLYHW